MKCPCEDCLCVPICRHKIYTKLVECSLITEYLIDPRLFWARPLDRILKVEECLKPIIWKPICCEDGVYIGLNRVNGGVPESG